MKQFSYRYRFDGWALGLFVAIMLPNIVWFCFPPAHDILHVNSVTPACDAIASFLQIQLVAALAFSARVDSPERLPAIWSIATILCVATYWIAWGLYYAGNVALPLILIMAIVPCLAFMTYSIGRKNWIVLIACGLFLYCHLFSTIKNFC